MKKHDEPKTFFIRTYGCQMNELDTDVMAGTLKRRGMERVEKEEDADLLLYNTCSIRDLAERKVMGKLGILGRSKKKERIIGVTGCMANNKKESLFKKAPHIDFILGTNNLHELNRVLDAVIEKGSKIAKTDKRFTHELDYLDADRPNTLKAYVSIIRGCDKYCTYCIVPYTRGPEVSRNAQEILQECRQLVDQGCQEITLLGQNVNSYGKDFKENRYLFHDLLHDIDQIKGLHRVRFLTSHPCDITRELMEAVRDLPSLCELVHFPMQAGSNRILKKMHRIYTIEEYLEKVALLRELVPHVKLGTDIIVGFPTETDQEFEETARLMEELKFSLSFIFAYSPRKGTPSTRWKDDVPEEIKQQRLQRLLDINEKNLLEERHGMLNQTVEVLAEKVTDRSPHYMKGLTRCYKNVLFHAPSSVLGTLQNVRLDSVVNNTFLGTLEQV